MNYDEFINTYKGKSFDYDGVSGVQCVDLVKMYLDKVYNIKAGAWGNAKEYYENFEKRSELVNNFEKIANTPTFIPQKGDILVWGTGIGKYGHIAIATGEGTTSYFYSYDLNWGNKIVSKIRHTYRGFLGVLRYKTKNSTTFEIGKTYTTQVNLNIRKEPNENSDKLKYSELTENAKQFANNRGTLNAGTKITCKDISINNNQIWIKIPSGWICAINNKKEYIK